MSINIRDADYDPQPERPNVPRTFSEIVFLIFVALVLAIIVPAGIVALILIWALSEIAELIKALRGKRAS